MILNIIYLILGLTLILAGANYLTDGASLLAKRWGMSDLMIGLTIVAFGTSAPELVISIMSAIEGSSGIAIGNVVGSNLFNVCVIVGITALVAPIKVTKSIMANDIPFVILSAIALLAIGSTALLDSGSTAAVLSRSNGIILLLFFVVFMRYTFASAKSEKTIDSTNNEDSRNVNTALWKYPVFILGGLAVLIFGGDIFVDGATGIASALGVSDAIIGLTIVAAGTSLPELATAVAAALKGKTGMALGNVIGSNIYNIFLVLGCSAIVRPLPFGSIGNTDLIVLVIASILFWVFGWFFKTRTITRSEGAVLLLIYIAFITMRCCNA